MKANLFDLTGHAALVTGGNSGIGLGMARALVQAGASVAIWGTNEEKNAKAVAGLQALAGDDGGGSGLGSMRERVALFGGQLSLVSAPGEGTQLRAVLPLRGDSSEEA